MTTDTRGIGIAGQDIVCSTEQYSMGSQNVSWSTSNPSGLTINASTGEATRVGSFNGQITIIATIAGACGNTNFTKTVTVGTPTPTGINGPNYDLCRQRDHPQNEGAYHVNNPLPGVTYHWEFVRSNGQVFSLGSDLVVWINASAGIFFSSGAGTHTLRVRAFSCGQFSPWHSSSIIFLNCSMARLAIYPNPASEELNISYQADSINGMDFTFEEYQITLLNSGQEKIYSFIGTEKSVTIPIGQFPKGTYYLIINNKESVIQRRIIIDR